uniref:UDP-N-acetylglucosamine/UDP-glucose/GDP-mannose transporter n=1 Tax=Aceria tosichella TaxID=561515 RepID=A0A6G1SMQ9_9ACAR
MIKDQSRPEHTYVILNQQPPNDESNEPEEEQHNNEEAEIGTNPAESSFSIDDKSRRGFLSRSRFSDLTLKLLSALFYGICSFLITVINKIVLTSYGFPSITILGVGQMIAIILILRVASLLNIVAIREQSIKNRKLWILSSLYLGNLITGLGGTKHLPLPMFIALRRFSIALTAIAEFYMLNVRQSLSIVCTIIAMIGGSFIAAAADLTFNAKGYLLVMISNLFTAANGVYTKKTIDAREINKHEILYYNALFSILPLTLISICTNNLETLGNFQHWSSAGFILSFLTSCLMGYLLMFSTVLCTHYNSALTTTIVGTLKNILTTYVGMYIGGDYLFNLMNFIGLNMSLVGSLVYSYLSFTSKTKPKEVPTKC